eukprot:1759114-Heterocapsa_arctica.AAC.1
MEDFLNSCVDRHLELAGPGTKMKTVATPFLTQDMNQSLVRKPLHHGPSIECPWCKHTFQEESKTGRSVAVAVCLGPNAIIGEGEDQPSPDSIDNCTVCDNALMIQVQTLSSPGRPVGITSFAAAASSKPGGSLPPPSTD